MIVGGEAVHGPLLNLGLLCIVFRGVAGGIATRLYPIARALTLASPRRSVRDAGSQATP